MLVELLALRTATVFFDLLTIAVLYRIGRRIANHTAATWAALLYALSPGDIYLWGWWIQIDAWVRVANALGSVVALTKAGCTGLGGTGAGGSLEAAGNCCAPDSPYRDVAMVGIAPFGDWRDYIDTSLWSNRHSTPGQWASWQFAVQDNPTWI